MNTRRPVNAFLIGLITFCLYLLVFISVKLILNDSNLQLNEAMFGALIFGLVFFAIQHSINLKLEEKPIFLSKV